MSVRIDVISSNRSRVCVSRRIEQVGGLDMSAAVSPYLGSNEKGARSTVTGYIIDGEADIFPV